MTVFTLAPDTLAVQRPSDNVADGHCAVDELDIATGSTSLVPVAKTRQSVTASCREHDKNEGDCAVIGEITCF